MATKLETILHNAKVAGRVSDDQLRTFPVESVRELAAAFVRVHDAFEGIRRAERLRVVDQGSGVGPVIQAHVRDEDLRGWHWDWIQTLSSEDAELFQFLLAKPAAPVAHDWEHSWQQWRGHNASVIRHKCIICGVFRSKNVGPCAPPAQELSDLLSLVGVVVSEETARKWRPERRRQAWDWAAAAHLAASDNDVEVPPRPEWL